MNSKTTVLSQSQISSSASSYLFTILALALGITFPQLFHSLGIGATFLPMFLPTVLLALVAPWQWVAVVTLLTPLLNTLLFGMPQWHTTPLLTAELTFTGFAIVLSQRKLPVWIAVPLVFIVERILVYSIALLIPSLKINLSAILASYPGVMMNSVVAILISRLFIEQHKNG